MKDYKEERWKISVDEFKRSKVIGKNNYKFTQRLKASWVDYFFVKSCDF